MSAYYSLPDSEKLALTDAAFIDAVNLEAINRKLVLPVETSDLIPSRTHTDDLTSGVRFYEILVWDGYQQRPTGLAFTSEKRALDVIQGAVIIKEEYNYNTKLTTKRLMDESDKISVRVVILPGYSIPSSPNIIPKIEDRDTSKWEELYEECQSHLSNLRADEYNRKLRIREAQKFLTLAKGDLTIAASFWNNYYPSTPFPTDEERASIPTT